MSAPRRIGVALAAALLGTGCLGVPDFILAQTGDESSLDTEGLDAGSESWSEDGATSGWSESGSTESGPFDEGFETARETDFSTSFDEGFETDFETALDTGFETSFESGFETSLDTAPETGWGETGTECDLELEECLSLAQSEADTQECFLMYDECLGGLVDTGTDTETDSVDTGWAESSSEDGTSGEETGVMDTGSEDTGSEDTGTDTSTDTTG
ncbi:hypothetical protein PPSIR1_14230 [Plesiocystis pacifica SIR-1]|uniref:Uncharacterized protein n=1 Tax=Plesiocystis pacifica SIR-1 TaxID=391625 RepID=A6GH24_9BACT|nr:hypothetical protein [Plesiocystis pacifica]EDM74802.1 hypothetical protein PPSIR1_14230 [Plesiocystis pacifica SIR-1]